MLGIVTAVWPPRRGGMVRVAFTEAGVLATLRPVRVFTLAQKQTAPAPLFSVTQLCAWPRIGLAGFTPQLLWRLWSCKVVYVQAPAFGMMWPVIFWKFLRRRRLVVTLHMDPVGQGGQRFIFWWARLELRALLAVADVVRVSTSTGPQNKLLSRPATVIPFGLEEKYFISSEKKWPEHFIALFVGALDKQHYFKGVSVLLRAWAEFSLPGELWIVGEGNRRAFYEQEATALGIGERVRFWGAVSDERLCEIYQQVSVAVLPSTDSSETFGLVLIEAMAAALPVIASDLPGINTVVRSQWGQLVPPRNVAALAGALRRLIDNPGLAAEQSRAALQAAAAYQLSAVVSRLNHLL